MFRLTHCAALLALCPFAAGAVDVEYAPSAGDALSVVDRQSIERIAQAAEADVRDLLTGLPDDVVVEVRAEQLPHSPQGVSGQAIRPRRVIVIVDPTRDRNVSEIAERF